MSGDRSCRNCSPRGRGTAPTDLVAILTKFRRFRFWSSPTVIFANVWPKSWAFRTRDRLYFPSSGDGDVEPLIVTGLADAFQVALGVADRFKRGHASVALDSDGTVVDLTCFTGRHHTVTTALSWADFLSYNEPRFASLILISAVDDGVKVLAEEDVEWFRKARKVCADSGIRLIDWIKTDANDLRTMAISCGDEGGWNEPSD